MISRTQLDLLADRVHLLTGDVGELSAQCDRECGEDSKAAYRLSDALAGLEKAYTALVCS